MNPIQLWWTTTPRVLRSLMAALAGGFVLYLVLRLFGEAAVAPFDRLRLEPDTWLHRPWTVLTHSLVMPEGGLGALLSVVFALLFLNQIGRDAEQLLGPRWLVGAWLAATAGASVTSILGHYSFGVPAVVFGPWSAVLGLMLALGLRFPDKSIGLLFVGVVRLVYVAVGLVVVSMLLAGKVWPIIPDVGGLLGGALFGLYSKAQVGQRASVRPSASHGGSASAADGRSAPRRAAGSSRATAADLDRVLEKISAQGMDALTPEERRVLDEASRR